MSDHIKTATDMFAAIPHGYEAETRRTILLSAAILQLVDALRRPPPVEVGPAPVEPEAPAFRSLADKARDEGKKIR